MSKPSKQELKSSYKERAVIGGIYAIKNKKSGKMLLQSTPNLASAQNRFEFAKSNPTSLNLRLLADVKEHSIDAFEFTILEELEKQPNQTSTEFNADLAALLELWIEKTQDALQY